MGGEVWLVDRERHAGFREASRVKVPHWRGRRRQCELLSDLPQSATRLRLAGEFPKLVLAEATGVSCAGGAGTANRQRARASNTWLGGAATMLRRKDEHASAATVGH
jgi:hypothetical protein